MKAIPDSSFPPLLSLIIPVLNEEERIRETLEDILVKTSQESVEIIVVDGGSERDRTVAVLQEFKEAHPSLPFYFHQIHSRGRAFQMNFGFRQSRGQYILFVHADTHLPPGFVPLIKEALKPEKGHDFCFFNISFREKTWALNLVSWLANHVRRIPYGDQAFCFRREFFEKEGGFAEQVFLEDLDFIMKCRKRGSGRRMTVPVSTSARRYRNSKGELTPFSVFRQSLRNGWIVILSRVFRKRPSDLRAFYERR